MLSLVNALVIVLGRCSQGACKVYWFKRAVGVARRSVLSLEWDG